MRPTQDAQNPEERRRFERVDIAHQSQVLVLDAKGRQTGILRQLARGGYILVDALGSVPDVILIGSGSEVSLCVAARDLLATENIRARVVSMPSWELFDAQDPAYQQGVLPPAVTARVTVEEASPIGWERYAGPHGVVLGMRSFGMSAPMKIVAEHFGFKAEHVAAAAKSTMRRAAGGTNSQADLIRS